MDQAEQLRNVIRQQNKRMKKSARVITVTSGKGGVGKSNLAVNLAVQFQRMGKRTIIFDADFGLANVEVMFGTVPKYCLSDLIYQNKNIEDILADGPEGIRFVSGGSGMLGLNNLSIDQISYLVRAIDDLSEMADIVLVDTGAGISDSVMEFVLASPEILLVTTPDPTSLTDAYSLLKVLFRDSRFDKEESFVRIVANRALSQNEGNAVYEKLSSVVRQFLHGNVEYAGMILQDNALEQAVRMQKPVSIAYPNSKASKSYEKMAQHLMNKEDAGLQPKAGLKQFLSKVFNLQ